MHVDVTSTNLCSCGDSFIIEVALPPGYTQLKKQTNRNKTICAYKVEKTGDKLTLMLVLYLIFRHCQYLIRKSKNKKYIEVSVWTNLKR